MNSKILIVMLIVLGLFTAGFAVVNLNTNQPLLDAVNNWLATNNFIDITVSGTINDLNISDFNTSETYWSGTFDESFDARVTSDGATVTMSLERSGGGSLTMNFNGDKFALDTSPALTIALDTGSDASPTENFIFIPVSTKVLTKSTSNWPNELHIKVAYFLVPSAVFVQGDGPYINQNWNDHKAGTDGQGHQTHEAERSRRMGAVYFSGIVGSGTDNYASITTNGGDDDNVFISATSGIIYQMHKHTVPDFNSAKDGNLLLIVNHPTTAYFDTNDLGTQNLDSTGSTMSQYRNYVIWGVANKTGEYSPYMVNLPSGSYNSQSDATNDTSGFDNFTIPDAFNRESSTGFLIARITMRRQASGGGTWTHIQTTDLRGVTPTQAAGGAVGGVKSTFADNIFELFDESDDTKRLKIDVGTSVPTGTTVTITVPPEDLDLNSPSFPYVTATDANIANSLDLNSINVDDNFFITNNGIVMMEICPDQNRMIWFDSCWDWNGTHSIQTGGGCTCG